MTEQETSVKPKVKPKIDTHRAGASDTESHAENPILVMISKIGMIINEKLSESQDEIDSEITQTTVVSALQDYYIKAEVSGNTEDVHKASRLFMRNRANPREVGLIIRSWAAHGLIGEEQREEIALLKGFSNFADRPQVMDAIAVFEASAMGSGAKHVFSK